MEACPYQNCLSDEARELIQFVSTRYMASCLSLSLSVSLSPFYLPPLPYCGPAFSSLSCTVLTSYHFLPTCRDPHRPPWPFADLSNKLSPSSEVPELSTLVGRVLSVFQHVPSEPLKENWAKIALQVGTVYMLQACTHVRTMYVHDL